MEPCGDAIWNQCWLVHATLYLVGVQCSPPFFPFFFINFTYLSRFPNSITFTSRGIFTWKERCWKYLDELYTSVSFIQFLKTSILIDLWDPPGSSLPIGNIYPPKAWIYSKNRRGYKSLTVLVSRHCDFLGCIPLSPTKWNSMSPLREDLNF